MRHVDVGTYVDEPSPCQVCGRDAYWRDHAGRPVHPCCIGAARDLEDRCIACDTSARLARARARRRRSARS